MGKKNPKEKMASLFKSLSLFRYFSLSHINHRLYFRSLRNQMISSPFASQVEQQVCTVQWPNENWVKIPMHTKMFSS